MNRAALIGAAALLGATRAASALELGSDEHGQAPVLAEVTNASSVLYNVDNRDSRPREVASRANDDWGLFYNRLNLQATSGRWTLSTRVDSAWFFASPSPADIADDLARAEEFPSAEARDDFYRGKATEAGIELSNRYIDWTYPAKVLLLYTGRDFDVAVGDSQAQFGRGLVLSLRKLDELASDTTVRGVRVSGRVRAGDTRLELTVLGGSLNPLRIDEASGRYLGVDASALPSFTRVTEAGMPRAVGTDFVPETARCASFGTCSYAPDRVLAAQGQVALGSVTLGTQGSLLVRQAALSPELVRTADRIFTASQSVELPRVFGNASVYVEAAIQKLDHRGANEPDLDTGHALYLASSWAERRFSLLAELKHYRRFFPLMANVSSSRAREFSLLQYSAPPTTEEVWNDTEFGNFNTCVSGGRVRADVHARRTHSVYGWVGHYRSFAESAANERCELGAENENRVWDLATGLDLTSSDRRRQADVSVGTRFDTSTRELAGADGDTHVFYRELFLRYDLHVPLAEALGLELQGFHRRRRETVGGPEEAWLEGQHSTGVDIGERVTFALGLEYDTRPEVANGYVNAMVTYRPLDNLNLGLFVGQRRGAQRCVGGVCRIYPPFEGARLDATLRF